MSFLDVLFIYLYGCKSLLLLFKTDLCIMQSYIPIHIAEPVQSDALAKSITYVEFTPELISSFL